MKRIFGTVTPEEYAAVKERAEEACRSVWGQVWAEAQAYRNGQILASGEVAEQQRQLIAELRRIGNNLNQLAKLGHIQARKDGDFSVITGGSHAVETLRHIKRLEAAVARFDDGISITVRPEHRDDS